jgi:putative inorganic carbon (HCO3(-)) transporter
LLLGGLVLSIIFLLGANFGATKLPFINQEIYTALPGGGLRPFWNSDGFNANMSGGVLALFLAPAIVLIWAGDSWQQRDLAKLVTLVLSVLLLLTQARGALMGVMVALPVITLLHSQRWLLVWAAVLILGGGIIFYLGGPDIILESVLGQGDDALGASSLQSRQELWERAFYIIQDFPLTGVGLGMVEPVVKLLYPTFVVYPEANFKHAHNIYLQVGAELGLPGLIAHLSLYLLLLHLLLQRALDHWAGYYRALALGLLGALVIFLTHGFFEVITYAPRAAIIVWGLFGLMVAVATSTPNPSEPDY